MTKVSVIVPVYNVAAFLPRCLDSLLAQTLREIEIVCVDDGSTDGSGALLDGYAAKDGRIRVIHQANAGVGPARNRALPAITITKEARHGRHQHRRRTPSTHRKPQGQAPGPEGASLTWMTSENK